MSLDANPSSGCFAATFSLWEKVCAPHLRKSATTLLKTLLNILGVSTPVFVL